jgi:hypothetical protein
MPNPGGHHGTRSLGRAMRRKLRRRLRPIPPGSTGGRRRDLHEDPMVGRPWWYLERMVHGMIA